MEIKISSQSFFIFDLDDTLFQEVEFLKSAYSSISKKLEAYTITDIYPEMLHRYHSRENVFRWIVDSYKEAAPEISMEWLIKEYREHIPNIELSSETLLFLDTLKSLMVPAGLITDGRSLTQRNKLKALGIEDYFKEIIISEEFGSEKPDERNYTYFENKYPGRQFYFFGDNTSKDFIVPVKLGWRTICLKSPGSHIHLQSFTTAPVPEFIISSFQDVKLT